MEALSPLECPDCGLPVLIPVEGSGTAEDPFCLSDTALHTAICRHVRALPELHPTLARPRWPTRARQWVRRRWRRREY